MKHVLPGVLAVVLDGVVDVIGRVTRAAELFVGHPVVLSQMVHHRGIRLLVDLNVVHH